MKRINVRSGELCDIVSSLLQRTIITQWNLTGGEGRWEGQYTKPQKGVSFSVAGNQDGRPLKAEIKAELPVKDMEHDQLPRLWAGARQRGWGAIPGSDFKSAADSTGWRLGGHSVGHGVGMCQLGAIGMANAGAGFREILTHYYLNPEQFALP
jgi:SpoIID/LytB domain protein